MAQIDRCTIVLEACTGRFIGRGSSRRLVQVQRQREGRELLAHFAASALACKSLHRSRRCVASTYPVREPQASVRLILGSSLKWIALCAYPLNFSGERSVRRGGPVRAMPIGAELQPDGGVHFRIWAPLPKSIVLVVDGVEYVLQTEEDGYRSVYIAAARTGSRYGYRVGRAGRSRPAGKIGEAVHLIDSTGCDCRLGALLGRRLRGEAAYHLRLRRRAPDRRRHHARAPQQHHRRPGFADCSGATYVILTLAITTLHSGPVSTTPVAA